MRAPRNARSTAWPERASASSSANVKGGYLVAIALKDLLEAGVHFGHQTKRWNPKMKEYIFGERNGIYILDLGKTLKLVRDAEEFVSNLAAEGRPILFVGTKRQAKDVIAEEALRSIRLFASRIADAVLNGRGLKESVDAESSRDTGSGEGGDDRRQPPRAPRRTREAAPASA